MVVGDKFFDTLNGGMTIVWSGIVIAGQAIMYFFCAVALSILAYVTLPLWPIIAGFYLAHHWMYPPEK